MALEFQSSDPKNAILNQLCRKSIVLEKISFKFNALLHFGKHNSLIGLTSFIILIPIKIDTH